MSNDKKSEDWGDRGVELEKRGIVPGLIGSKARMERLGALRKKAQYFRSIVVRAAKAQVRILIVDKPELSGNHLTVGMILELPLKGGSLELSGKASSALRAFVREAVGSSRKPARPRPRRTKLA